MEKIMTDTIDVTKHNIEKIRELFPNCISETFDKEGHAVRCVNFELLRQMLSNEILNENESYEFTWVGKRASIIEANKATGKTLRPYCKVSKNWDKTENLYIEGDNLAVLKILQESYLNKIKMIYIDPPYNTGNDFLYADDFRIPNDEWNAQSDSVDLEGNRLIKNNDSNGRFHSDWCSMIYARLLIARNLLSDDGFIAISIGEEEAYNLREICNEVFGESNFRNIVAVRRYDKNINLQFAAEGLTSMNVGLEYILIYSKRSNSKMTAVYKDSSDERTHHGYWKGFWNNADRPTMRYSVLGVLPKEGQWKWKKELADEAVANYEEYKSKYASKMTLEEYWLMTGESKRFLRRNQSGTGKNLGVEHWVPPAKGILRNSNWSDYLISKPIGLDIKFDSPKNPEVISKLIELFGVKHGDTILDFFSGSGTTAEAVMQLNAEDGENRKFIMVQLPERCDEKSEAYKAGFRTICDIGEERIRRAAKRIHEDNTAAKFDDGFRVFKIDSSNVNDVGYTADGMTQDLLSQTTSNIKADRTDLDLLFDCLLKEGVEITYPYSSEVIDGCTVHNYNNGALIACFDENVSEIVMRKMAEKKPIRAIFRDSSFKTDADRINVEELFKLISPDTTVKVI